MLYVSLQAYPDDKPLGAIAIENVGTDDMVHGHFNVQLYDSQGQESVQVRLNHFAYSKGAWALVREALIALKIDEA